MSHPLKTLNLGKGLETALKRKHPWIYRNHLPKHSLEDGDWVRLEAGNTSAIGLYDAASPIAVRLFSRSQVPDRHWIHKKVKRALELRRFIPKDTDAYRLIYGEGDGLPGIVADKYGRYVIIKTYSKSVEIILDEVVRALSKELTVKGIAWRKIEGLEALWGELPPPEVTVEENGLSFIANLYDGQKTGLFLDQRENRQALRAFSAGKRVLNLFSYNGGFSIYALAGGASSVRSVDIAEAANHDAERNVVANKLELSQHETVTTDVFKLLETYVYNEERFDIVVLDPPSLAKDKKSRFAALRAYQKLNKQAFNCIVPGGLLVSSSCTSQVGPEDFKKMLADAAQSAGVTAQLIHEAGHALDHPVPVHFPEGRYLKFSIMRVLERE